MEEGERERDNAEAALREEGARSFIYVDNGKDRGSQVAAGHSRACRGRCFRRGPNSRARCPSPREGKPAEAGSQARPQGQHVLCGPLTCRNVVGCLTKEPLCSCLRRKAAPAALG